MTTRTCANGHPIGETDLYCGECGVPLTPTEATAEPDGAGAPETPSETTVVPSGSGDASELPDQAEPEARGHRRGFVVLAMVLVLVVLVTGGAFALTSGGGTGARTATRSTSPASKSVPTTTISGKEQKGSVGVSPTTPATASGAAADLAVVRQVALANSQFGPDDTGSGSSGCPGYTVTAEHISAVDPTWAVLGWNGGNVCQGDWVVLHQVDGSWTVVGAPTGSINCALTSGPMPDAVADEFNAAVQLGAIHASQC